MRRALVLTQEGFRHPMRVNLPQRRSAFGDFAASIPAIDLRLTASDVRGVATTYFATFAAVLAFIA